MNGEAVIQEKEHQKGKNTYKVKKRDDKKRDNQKKKKEAKEQDTSIAPPPATIAECASARRTIMIASCRERSASSMYCSAPPRNTIVAVLV